MITLITPPALKAIKGLQMQTPGPPLGTAYLAGMLKAIHYPYAVVDGLGLGLDVIRPSPMRSDLMIQGLSLDEIVERIPDTSRYIGISVMFSTLWPISLELLQRVRARFPKATIIAGGEHITAVSEYCLRNSPIDIAVRGEGENPLIELLETLDRGGPREAVPSIAFLNEKGKYILTSGVVREKHVDKIPWPDWDSIPIEGYITNGQLNGVNRGRSMPILGTRGCPFKCTFCSNPLMYTQRWIPRNSVDLVDEMQTYVNKYRVRNFDFQDLTAFVKKEWIVGLTREILRRNLKITWQLPSGTRSEVFDRAVADLVYKAGCRNVAFAPESGDERILKEVKKQVNLEHLERAVRDALAAGLVVGVFIVIGFPTDNTESLRKTARFLRRMALLGVHDCAVSKFIPYPGSPLFVELQKKGKLALNDDFFISPMDFYAKEAESYCENVSAPELYRWMMYLFLSFYILSGITHPLRTLRIILKALFTGYEETRYAKFINEKIYTRTKWLFQGWKSKRQEAKSGTVTARNEPAPVRRVA
jgi:radical SAM superfamily enzyme YgiQ (UPF0313 family)